MEPQKTYVDDPRDFRQGLLTGAIPLVVIGIVLAAIAQQGNGGTSIVTGIIWIVVLFMLLIADIVTAVTYSRQGHKKKAAGLLLGLSIGVVAMGISCFAQVNAFEFN